MLLDNVKIGFALTGSFCTLDSAIAEMENMISEGAQIYPIVSYAVKNTDTRFGLSGELLEKITKICGRKVMDTLVDVEPLGPKGMIDIMLIAPCTGNTLSKIANAITDTPVLMATKAHLRNNKPVVISISTNDALGANARNLGQLLNAKNVFFVPFYQDSPNNKPNSLISDTRQIIPTVMEALKGLQTQPCLI
jgi:dipicolinate synthase subunit B